jgi:hypothetical protein
MRELIVSIFLQKIDPYLINIESIAVVGGSKRDPEVVELEKAKTFVVKTYGIDDESDFKLDLNLQNDNTSKYDLVLCSQTFEHIYDLKNGMLNLAKLMKETSLLWLACPASNRSHGSPDYYSAGYQPELIINLAKELSLEPVTYGKVGSKRNYFFTHALRVWPTSDELKHPITRYNFARLPHNSKLNLFRFLRDIPGRIYSCFIDNTVSGEVEYATETYVLLKKITS